MYIYRHTAKTKQNVLNKLKQQILSVLLICKQMKIRI